MLQKKPSPMRLPPSVVEVSKAKQTIDQQQISAIGSLAAVQGIVVRPEIPGKVSKIYVKSGQMVTANTPLIEINPNIYQAQLAQAQARLKLAKLAYGRAAKLYKTHAVSTAELDQAAENMNVEEGEVAELQAKLAQTIIKAPFGGRLGLIQVNVGDYVNIGQAIVNLQALDPLRVDFTIPETYLASLAVGQKVTVKVDPYPGKIFTGQIYALDSRLDSNTRSLAVRAKINNPEHKLLPGIFAEVTLFIGTKKPAISIPQTALMYDASGSYVYKVVKNRAVKTAVTVGKQGSKTVVITKGLTVNAIVVSAGQIKLRDGSAVMVK